MLGVIKRIVAEYDPVEDHENHLNWNGGEYTIFNNVRFEFNFVIIRMKSGIAEW
jgi:hypothetical protein